MENFKRPYFSKSIQEFCRRWHISLSTWFKDYLYIPLGGNRVSKARYYFNIFVTFLLSGLWHGFNWTFIVWGGLHGFYLIIGTIKKKTCDNVYALLKLGEQSKLKHCIKILITFVLVDFAWIFFRAKNIFDSIYIIKNIFNGLFQQMSSFAAINNSLRDLSKWIYLLRCHRWYWWKSFILSTAKKIHDSY